MDQKKLKRRAETIKLLGQNIEWDLHDTGLATDAKDTGNRKKSRYIWLHQKQTLVCIEGLLTDYEGNPHHRRNYSQTIFIRN